MSPSELEALDRILSGEPLEPDELELELAALVASVRADAPAPDAETALRLDERIAAAGTRRRRRPTRRPNRRWWGAGAVTAVAGLIAAAIVLGGGSTGGASRTETGSAAFAPTNAPSVAATPAVTPAPSAPTPSPPAGPAPANRLQQRTATLTLATRASSLGSVANQIIADSEQLGAIVQSSNVAQQGRASLATFTLDAPSGSLSELIARLSGLAQVQSLTTNTQDITDAYGAATDRLAASRRERDALFAALARATTSNQTQSLKDQIDALTGRIAADERAVATLRSDSRTASVQITLQPTNGSAAAPPHPGRLRRAVDTAGDVLSVMAAAAIVALAVIGPLALLALIAWGATRVGRRRARDRALERA